MTNSLDQTTTDWLTDLSDADEAMNAAFARYLNLSAAQNAPTGGSATAAADSALNKNGAPGSGATADEARWWDNLTNEQRAALITEYPEVIGGADGLPTDVRDRANRINLDADLAELEHEEDQGTLGADQRKELDTARSVSNALNGLDKEGNPFPQFDENGEPIKNPSTPPIDPITGKPVETFLLVYKPEAHGGDGGVAISIGDPGTADNVAVTVPGIRTEGDDSANGTRDAYNAYSSARFSDPSGSTASIFWLDYNSPSSDDVVPDMIFQDEANKGAKNLNSFVRRLTENNPSAHYTAIGHSYGSVVVAQSGADHHLPVDDFVLIGSPGPGRDIDHASDLGVSADHVFIGDASDDNVSKLSDGPGLHGVDVTREGFGGVRFQAESPDRDLNNPLNFDGHSRYFVPESESLNNIRQIIVGDRDEVTEADYEYNKVTRGRVPVSIHIDPESKREPTVVEREPEW